MIGSLHPVLKTNRLLGIFSGDLGLKQKPGPEFLLTSLES
jgi:hypothetical protein